MAKYKLQKRWEGRQRGNKGRIEEDQEEEQRRQQVERQREEEALEERLEEEGQEEESRVEGRPRLPPSSSFTFSPETIGPGPQWYPTVDRVVGTSKFQIA